MVQEPTGDGNAPVDLTLQIGPVGILHKPCRYAIAGEGLDLGVGIGGVAVLLHPLEVLVIRIGAANTSRPQEGREHGAAGAEAHPLGLT